MVKFNHYVSVIIPTYHDWQRLQICLRALQQQTYPQANFEVIIINNDPEDKPPALDLAEHWQLINESQPGSYAARNAGLAIAQGEIVAFTDSDCVPCHDWLEKGVTRLERGAQRVAGYVQLFYQSNKLTLAEIYEKTFAFNQALTAYYGASVTANMMTWKHYFETVGPFDAALKSGGDIEWGERAYAKGVAIQYSPEVVVEHPARAKFKDILNKKKRTCGWKMISNKNASSEKWLKLCLTGFLPPLIILWHQLRLRDLGFYKKIKLLCFIYFVKIYVTICKIKLKLQLRKQEN